MAAPTSRTWHFHTADGLPTNDQANDNYFWQNNTTGVTEDTTVIKHGPSSFKRTTSGIVCEGWVMYGQWRAWDDSSRNNKYASSLTGREHLIGGVWFRLSALPSSRQILVRLETTTGTTVSTIQVDTDGTITHRLGDGPQTVMVTSSVTAAANTWHYLEWYTTSQDPSARTKRLWVDGTHDSASYQDSSGNITTVVYFLGLDATTNMECPWIGAGTAKQENANAQFSSPASAWMRTNETGSVSDWTGVSETTNKHLNVDETDIDTATYNHTSTQNNIQRIGSDNTIAGKWSATIDSHEAVFAFSTVARNSSATCLMKWGQWEASTYRWVTTAQAPRNSTTEADEFGVCSHDDPGGAAWDATSMEAVETAVSHEQSQTRELRQFTTRIFVLVEVGAAADNDGAAMYHHLQNLGVYG